MDIDQHILQALSAGAGNHRPITINDLARRFGISAVSVRPACRRLVEGGQATASTVLVNGVPTLHGLLPAGAGSPAS
jgi:DNA-binding Lrp family transcriptional regulator